MNNDNPNARFIGLDGVKGEFPTLNDHPEARTEAAFFTANYFLNLAEHFGLEIAKVELKLAVTREELDKHWRNWLAEQANQ